jgi:hypothetical protein
MTRNISVGVPPGGWLGYSSDKCAAERHAALSSTMVAVGERVRVLGKEGTGYAPPAPNAPAPDPFWLVQ